MSGLFQRIAIALQDIKSPLDLLTLHSDLDEIFSGGTEGHVRRLRTLLLQDHHAVLTLTPRGRRKPGFRLRGLLGNTAFLDEIIQDDSLPALISLLENVVDRLHVHHAKKWPRNALHVLVSCAIPFKILSVHDFWFLCPSVTLMTGHSLREERFCEIESNLQKCNQCLATKWRYTQENIQAWREFTVQFIQSFDAILFPSASLLPYFQKAYGDVWNGLSSKVKILPHDLSYLSAFPLKNTTQKPQKRIGFIGALSRVKGSELLLEAIPALEKLGFSIEIYGFILPPQHPNLKNVTISPYKSPQELAELLQENSKKSEKGEPDFLGYVSLWAETFSYVFYEGLLLTQNAIPIVGPFGHPAWVCNETGIGVVMQECSATALVDAVTKAYETRQILSEKRNTYIKQLREDIARHSYLEAYAQATDIAPHVIQKTALTEAFLIQASEKDKQFAKASSHWGTKLNQRLLRFRESLLKRFYKTVRSKETT